MEERKQAGFEEIEHTADWALRVWAPDMASLLKEAARGMYALMGTEIEPGINVSQTLSLSFTDHEDLLVSFLSELLYFLEREYVVYLPAKIEITGKDFHAVLGGAPLSRQGKEIKAVTYHNLAIRDNEPGLEVTIVFDV